MIAFGIPKIRPDQRADRPEEGSCELASLVFQQDVSLHGRSGIDPWDITLEKLRGRAGHRLGKRTEAVGSPNHGR